MTKIRLDFGYDGTDFHGFARQQGLRTVQGTLEDTLTRLLGTSVEVQGSGRTDAGVHARRQVVHWTQTHGPPAERYPYLLRRRLPSDIIPVAASEVDDGFHARFAVRRKTYRYTIQRAKLEDVFTHRYSWHVPGELSAHDLRAAAQELVGTHDFTSLCAASTPVEDKVRTIYDITVVERATYLDIYCVGSGFLQYMVRIIVGTLVDAAQGKLVQPIGAILAGRDRRLAGQTAPARGLTLWDVEYSADST